MYKPVNQEAHSWLLTNASSNGDSARLRARVSVGPTRAAFVGNVANVLEAARDTLIPLSGIERC